MKRYALIVIGIGWISLVLGIISRVTFTPFNILPGAVSAVNFLDFANTCFLTAIAFILLELLEQIKNLK